MKIQFHKNVITPHLIVLCVYVFLYSFCTEVNASNSDYLVWNPITFGGHIIVITSLMVLLFFFNIKRYKVDIIFVMLMARFAFLLIPFLYFEGNSTLYFGSVATNLVIGLIYIVYREMDKWVPNGLKVILAFGLIISIETIITLIFGDYSWNDSFFKFVFGIPLGKSNYIGCFILPILGLLLFDIIEIKNIILKYLFLVIMITAIIIIKSRGTWLILFFLLVVYYYKIMKTHSVKKIYMNIFIVIVLIIVLFNCKVILDFLSSILLGNFNSLSSSQYGFFDRLTSLRSTVNSKAFFKFLEHPLVGCGPVYLDLDYRAHNIFLDCLYQSGLIGFFLYFGAIVAIFFKTTKNKLTNKGKNIRIILSLMILQAMIEPSLLMLPIDFLFWLLVCLMLGERKNT